jgi:hypothetical protein
VKVTQRKKGASVTVKGEFRVKRTKTVRMKITADPESWERLFYLANTCPEFLGNLIYLHFASPAFRRINSTPARGIHRGREEFMEKMRLGIPIVYSWVSLWLKENQQMWPDSLKKVVRDVIDNGEVAGRKTKPSALEITAHIIEKHFGIERKKQGFKNKWTDDTDTFRKNFVSKNNHYNTSSQQSVNLKKESLKHLLEISF